MREIKFGSVMLTLLLALACEAGAPSDETLGRQDNIPTPDRSQVQIIDRDCRQPDGPRSECRPLQHAKDQPYDLENAVDATSCPTSES